MSGGCCQASCGEPGEYPAEGIRAIRPEVQQRRGGAGHRALQDKEKGQQTLCSLIHSFNELDFNRPRSKMKIIASDIGFKKKNSHNSYPRTGYRAFLVVFIIRPDTEYGSRISG